MFSKILRGYWYPGHPGYNGIYKREYLSKLAKIEELDFITDPIDRKQMVGSYSTVNGFQDPVITIMNKLKHRQNFEVSAATVAYLCYNGAKSNITEDFLWREVNFYIAKTMMDQDDRMIYGCMYGLLRSGRGKSSVFGSVIKEFNQRVLHTLKPFQVFELIEACCLNRSDNFDAVDYMHVHLMPLFKENFKRCRFLFIESYLNKIITNLAAVEYYEEWVWEGIFDIICRKKFGDIDNWEKLYKIFLSLREAEIESGSGLSFDKVFEHLEGLWSRNPDFIWKYNLEEKRFWTVDEMVDRVKDTPVNLTWEEGEEHIKHQLPKWYWGSESQVNDEFSGLLDEYEDFAKESKKLGKNKKKS